jgi:hypothetical protein
MSVKRGLFLRKERYLIVFENTVFRNMFGPKRDGKVMNHCTAVISVAWY